MVVFGVVVLGGVLGGGSWVPGGGGPGRVVLGGWSWGVVGGGRKEEGGRK